MHGIRESDKEVILMEDNNFQAPYGAVDPNYNIVAKDFLTKAIVSCAISSLPVGSIIAIFMAVNNRKALLDYLSKGGCHTNKIKVSSALSRAGKYSGVACTIIWGVYFLFVLAALGIAIAAAASQIGRR